MPRGNSGRATLNVRPLLLSLSARLLSNSQTALSGLTSDRHRKAICRSGAHMCGAEETGRSHALVKCIHVNVGELSAAGGGRRDRQTNGRWEKERAAEALGCGVCFCSSSHCGVASTSLWCWQMTSAPHQLQSIPCTHMHTPQRSVVPINIWLCSSVHFGRHFYLVLVFILKRKCLIV